MPGLDKRGSRFHLRQGNNVRNMGSFTLGSKMNGISPKIIFTFITKYIFFREKYFTTVEFRAAEKSMRSWFQVRPSVLYLQDLKESERVMLQSMSWNKF